MAGFVRRGLVQHGSSPHCSEVPENVLFANLAEEKGAPPRPTHKRRDRRPRLSVAEPGERDVRPLPINFLRCYSRCGGRPT